MRILSAVVGPTARFMSAADAKFLERSAIGPKPICHDLFCTAMPPQRFLIENQSGIHILRLRHEAFVHLAFVLDSAPKIVPFAVDLLENLIKVSLPAARPHVFKTSLASFGSEQSAKPVPPEPHRFVADIDATFMQQILYVAQRRREPDVHHHR